ncbi:hypothetical protein OTU49_016254 [Cherax quadricarinatus]|uniref:Chitin-binding type-2 domain-containing protein n=1 Tax=Cherax quadricarinatus TaxID=27406 RepID=A0AAW0XTV0_CHEQU|nr:uncharacterized protein LOC128688643 [Cherax quadricarinatus]
MSKHLLFISLSVWCVAVLLSVGAVFSADPCVPDCSSSAQGDKVEDPLNCTNYYICLDVDLPTDYPVPCDAGTSFLAADGDCTGSTPCLPTCEPENCHSTCDSTAVDIISDAKNCSIYYLCANGNIIMQMNCPTNYPYFDAATEACVSQKSVCCSDVCVPYCHADELQTVDPTDCTKYYICKAEGPVDPTLHHSCDSGSNFDVSVGLCVAGAPCITLCSGSTTPGEGTTPTPGGNCTTSMTCSSLGYFAKCSYCQQQYYHCVQAGEEALVESCTGSLVFNPGTDYPYCVSPSDCPHKSLF